MSITISSKNNEKVFNDSTVINIGSAQRCNYKLNLDFDLIITLQKGDNGKWQVLNNFKSDKVLFRGQPIGKSIEIVGFINSNGSISTITLYAARAHRLY